MISQITEHLFIGNANDACYFTGLNNLGITSILNVAHDLNDPYLDSTGLHTHIRFFKVGLTDGSANRGGHYTIAKNLLKDLIMHGDKVLVHCHEGRSRSAFITTMALAEYPPCSSLSTEAARLQAAYNLICQRRPLCFKMNDYFKGYLGVK